MARLESSEVARMVEEATQSVAGTVLADMELGRLDGWDSMGLVIFVELTRERAGVELAVHDLRACATCEAIRDLIERHDA